MRVTLICKTCGNTFDVIPARANKAKFCSFQCYWESLRELKGERHHNWIKGAELVCPECQRIFRKLLSERRGKRTFCSIDCLHTWQKKHSIGVEHPRWNPDREYKCQECGKTFRRNSGADNKFCSQSCFGSWRSRNISGQNHYNWHGGSSRKSYKGFTAMLKRRIRQRDRETCAICGKAGIDVHHIDYDKKNANDNNLITLCRSCHLKTNCRRDYWSARLNDVVQSLPYYGFERI